MMHENMPFKKAKSSKNNTVLCMKNKTFLIIVGMSGLMLSSIDFDTFASVHCGLCAYPTVKQ